MCVFLKIYRKIFDKSYDITLSMLFNNQLSVQLQNTMTISLMIHCSTIPIPYLMNNNEIFERIQAPKYLVRLEIEI